MLIVHERICRLQHDLNTFQSCRLMARLSDYQSRKTRELRDELNKALVVECEIYEKPDLEINEIMGNTSETRIWFSILGSRINLSGIVSRRMDHENEGTEVHLTVHH